MDHILLELIENSPNIVKRGTKQECLEAGLDILRGNGYEEQSPERLKELEEKGNVYLDSTYEMYILELPK